MGAQRGARAWVERVGSTARGAVALFVLGVALAVFVVGEDHLGVAYFTDDQDAGRAHGAEPRWSGRGRHLVSSASAQSWRAALAWIASWTYCARPGSMSS